MINLWQKIRNRKYHKQKSQKQKHQIPLRKKRRKTKSIREIWQTLLLLDSSDYSLLQESFLYSVLDEKNSIYVKSSLVTLKLGYQGAFHIIRSFYSTYPSGLFDCHLQESSHISSSPLSATQPSSSFAFVGSA